MELRRTAVFNLPHTTLKSTLLLLTLYTAPLRVVATADDPIQPAEYTDASEFEQAVLNVTNTYRSQHNATHVNWNRTLAEFAEEWGEDCVFKHSGGPYGENLASGYPNASASVLAWGHEREEYDFNKAEFSHETGHFTQLVWKNTSSMGCSRTNCAHHSGGAPGWYVICEYWPRGNVIGAFRENVQERVNEADEPKEECMQGALCSTAGKRMGLGRLSMWLWVWAAIWWVRGL